MLPSGGNGVRGERSAGAILSSIGKLRVGSGIGEADGRIVMVPFSRITWGEFKGELCLVDSIGELSTLLVPPAGAGCGGGPNGPGWGGGPIG